MILPPPGRLEAVCVSGTDLPAVPGRKPVRTGIDKRPVPGRVVVHDLGLDGDVQVNRTHHGGEGQAVYAYAQADADWWVTELGRELPAGRFGENLRTSGVDLTGALLGERWRVGTALLEVTAPRIPCANFARFWDEPQLVTRFTARGTTGAYLRVLETGDLGAGDTIEVVQRPDHGITAGLAFRALTTQKYRLPQLEPALAYLPLKASRSSPRSSPLGALRHAEDGDALSCAVERRDFRLRGGRHVVAPREGRARLHPAGRPRPGLLRK